MPKILYLMQGIPGSGKSTIAEMIAASSEGVIHSTDNLWYDDDGNYNYDADKAGAMHRINQQNVARSMVDDVENIIVDNTNLDEAAVAPYKMLARMFEYEVEVIQVRANRELCKARQLDRPEDRRVPNETIDRMGDQLKVIPL